MKAPADAVIEVRCGSCASIAGWVTVVDGQRVLTYLDVVKSRHGPTVKRRPVSIELNDVTLTMMRGTDWADVLRTRCSKKLHWGTVIAAQLEGGLPKTGRKIVMTRPFVRGE